MNESKALRTQGLVKEFAGVRAVDRLDLEVSTGTVFGLLGPNGSGKTTTIRTCLGIYVPDGGSVRLLDVEDPRDARGRIGYLPEERGLYPKMQVQEQLAFLGSVRGLKHGEATRRAGAWLDRLGLGDRAKARTNELSKGMQQKVQFAAAVIHEPELVILDEPFTGLDPVNTRLLKDVMLEQRDRGCTIILSSHRMEQVEQMCESLALIHRGRLVLEGTVKEIKARHGRSTVAIEYAGPARALADLPGVRSVSDSGRSARLQLAAGADTKLLIGTLLERVELHAFTTEEPSIEDIFLENVGRDGAAPGAESAAGGRPAELEEGA